MTSARLTAQNDGDEQEEDGERGRRKGSLDDTLDRCGIGSESISRATGAVSPTVEILTDGQLAEPLHPRCDRAQRVDVGNGTDKGHCRRIRCKPKEGRPI